MSVRIIFVFLFLFILGSQAQSQVDRVNAENKEQKPSRPSRPAQSIKNDSLPEGVINRRDSLGLNPKDSLQSNFEKSPDAITSEISYGSDGEKQIDLENRLVHLWDNAYVKYEDIEVQADYIMFNFETNIVTANATYDEHGDLLRKATFSEGDQNFQYNSFKYNFKTEKGIVLKGVTKEGELFVHGGFTKLVTGQDSTESDVLYNQDAIITSCNLDHPHFGIRSNKIKVIPNKVAVIGPSWLEIADVPTPLWLPFGFFPIANGKSSGLILPQNYDFSQAWGFGLQNIGYYFPINDYMDLRLTGDIYLRGSWSLNTDFKYNKRYKYSGGLLASRASRIQENLTTADYDRSVSYRFTWRHSQDPKAHPYRTFNTSVNILTAGYNNQNRTDAYGRTRDNISSSISYSYQFGQSPWSLTGGANLTQSLSAGTVDLDAPNFKLKMRQVYPFKRKEQIGKEKWYEKIGVTYSSEFRNKLSATDSTFYTASAWEDARYGIEHKATSNASFKFLKYFSFNPSANYSEIWYFKEVNQFNDGIFTLDTVGILNEGTVDETVVVDTTYGTIQENVEDAFLPFRTGSVGGGVSTKLFWTEQRKSGYIRGFRHTVTPAVNFAYSPDTESRYERLVDNDFRVGIDDLDTYSIIPSSVFTPSPRERSLSLSANIQNIIEFKYYSKRDSTAKKFKLTNFTINSGYNFVRDSMKLTSPSLTGRANYFNNKIAINYGFQVNPYKIENGKTIDRYVWQDDFELPNISDFSIRTTSSLRFREIKEWIYGKDKSKASGKGKSEGPITLSSLFDDFSIQYKLDYTYSNKNGIVTSGISANTLNIRGDIQITDNWFINLGNFGYDFEDKGYTYPDFGFSRQLHCWKMTFSWQPRGGTGFTQGNTSTFNFFIGVNGGTLDFLKYNYSRGNFDTLF